jgi:hypothetical protein
VLPSTAKKYGGVPRLVWALEKDADDLIQVAVDAIGETFQGMDISGEKRLAHRVLVIAMPQSNWEVIGFISQHVANLIYEAQLSNIFAQGKSLAGVLSTTKWCNSVVGMFFEPAFHHCCLQSKSLTVAGKSYAITKKQNGFAKNPCVDLNTLVIPTSRINDTFDSYVVNKNSGGNVTLVFLQVTVGDSHSAGTWKNAVASVYNEAKQTHGKVDTILMVYIVPNSKCASFVVAALKDVPKTLASKVSTLKEGANFKFLPLDK